jgi:hypothetical protein
MSSFHDVQNSRGSAPRAIQKYRLPQKRERRILRARRKLLDRGGVSADAAQVAIKAVKCPDVKMKVGRRSLFRARPGLSESIELLNWLSLQRLNRGSLMKSKFRGIWIVLTGLLLVLASVQDSHAVGSPDTRLIGLGINDAVTAPFTPGQLFEINKQTGALTPLGPQFVVETDLIGYNLTANSSGELYNARGGLDGRLNRLTLTGAVAHFVPISDGTAFPPYVSAIDFDSQDRLHGVTIIGAPNVDAVPVLSRIDVTTGFVSSVALWQSQNSNNMAFDPQDNLYSVAFDSGLVRIDTMTGQPTVIGGNLTGDIVNSITFDRDGTLLAATDRLFVVDPATGNTTPVGVADFGVFAMVGMAVIPMPEPTAFTLMGLVALRLRTARRRASRALGGSVIMNSCRQSPDSRCGEHETRRPQLC